MLLWPAITTGAVCNDAQDPHPIAPAVLYPQHAKLPLVSTPHTWFSPAEIPTMFVALAVTGGWKDFGAVGEPPSE
jgi:hypothetical protein